MVTSMTAAAEDGPPGPGAAGLRLAPDPGLRSLGGGTVLLGGYPYRVLRLRPARGPHRGPSGGRGAGGGLARGPDAGPAAAGDRYRAAGAVRRPRPGGRHRGHTGPGAVRRTGAP